MSGHNSQEVDLSLVLDAELIGRSLRRQHAELLEQRDKLLERHEHFMAIHIDGIKNEEDQGGAGDFTRQIRTVIRQADEARQEVKRPVLDAGRSIDGFFRNTVMTPLEAAAQAVLARMEEYAVAKAEAARKRLAEEAKQRQAEADRLAALAASDPAQLDAAIEAEQLAVAVATPPAADLSRTHSDFGTVSSLAEVWTWRLVDIRLVPRDYLMVNSDAVKAKLSKDPSIKRDKTQPIGGIQFYPEERLKVR